jgi:hypothetical protein
MIKLHPGQTRAFRSKARFVICSCGTGGGKTYLHAPWLAQRIVEKPGAKHLIIAPNYKILLRATIETLQKNWYGTCFQADVDENRMQMELSDGSFIYFGSGENIASIQGIQVDGSIILDEAGLCSRDVWITAQQRSGFAQARILVTTTPYDPSGWLYDIVSHPGEEYEIFNWSSIDNPYYPKEEYFRAQKELPPQLFDMRYNGLFGTVENACFPTFNTTNHIRTTHYQPELPILIGSDFNNAPMHWVLAQVVNNEIRVYDEIYIPRAAKTTDALNELWNRHSNHISGFQFYGDASGQAQHSAATTSDYQQIKTDERYIKAGRSISYPESNPGVVNRINSVEALLHQARLFIDESCRHLIADMKQARFKGGTRVVDKVSYDPHGADALGYLVYSIFPLKTPIHVGMGKVVVKKF